jgi:protein-S-isoprenylcysteine O-methyltransferase Ste14
MPIGMVDYFGAIYPALLTPIWLFIYILTAIEEEKYLLKKYGKEYEDYMKRVKRIIPFTY